jgi:hypothetical protein
VPTLTISALSRDGASELLARTAGAPVDQRVADRVVAETAGNPLALMEFAVELTADELAGVAPLHGPLRFGGRLDELYRSRVRALPEDAQQLLLIAAADESRDPAKIWQAAVTDIIGFSDRGHSLIIDSGWQAVATTALGWLRRQSL